MRMPRVKMPFFRLRIEFLRVAVLHDAVGVGLVAVVENAVVVNVRQRIKVGVRNAVWDDAKSVFPDGDHAVLERIGVVDGFLGVRFAGE